MPQAIAPPATPSATSVTINHDEWFAKNKDDRKFNKPQNEKGKDHEKESKTSETQERKSEPIRDKVVTSSRVGKTLDDLILEKQRDEKDGIRFGSRRREKIEEPTPRRMPSYSQESQEQAVSSGKAIGSCSASPCESAWKSGNDPQPPPKAQCHRSSATPRTDSAKEGEEEKDNAMLDLLEDDRALARKKPRAKSADPSPTLKLKTKTMPKAPPECLRPGFLAERLAAGEVEREEAKPKKRPQSAVSRGSGSTSSPTRKPRPWRDNQTWWSSESWRGK